MALALFEEAQKRQQDDFKVRPIIFLANNLTNRFKKKKSLSFFRDGYVGRHRDDPQGLIDTYCSG
jgi:hypothetical protein